ncbi:MAG: hypothetical protein WD070_06445 [Pirellulaceae bacterium]
MRIAVLLLLSVGGIGCSNDRLPTYPVQGRVVFSDGSPVHTGSIELKSREHGVQARGNIAADGSFQLTTYKQNDGAVEGTHDCVVVQLVMVEELSNFTPSTEGVVDARYGSYSKSGLECEVSPAKQNVVTITLEPMHPKPAGSGSQPHTHGPEDHSGHEHGSPARNEK